MRTKNTRSALLEVVLATLVGLAACPAWASEPDLLIPSGEALEKPGGVAAVRLGRIKHLAYSHDGDRLATAEEDGRVCVWQADGSLPARCVRQDDAGRLTAISFSRDDRWIALGRTDGSIDLHGAQAPLPSEPCRLPALKEDLAYGRPITSLSFWPDARGLTALGSKGGTGRSWAMVLSGSVCASERDRLPTELPSLKDLPTGLFTATAIDTAGKRVAIAIQTGLETALGVWEPGSGRRLWFVEKTSSPVGAMAISPDGMRLGVGLYDGRVRTYDMQSGRVQVLDSGHKKAVQALTFSSDGRSLASGSEDGTVAVWKLGSGSRLAGPTQRRASVTALAFQPDATILAIASEDSGVSFWDAAISVERANLRGNADWIRSLAFNPSGSLLATASDDQSLRIWERRPGQVPEWVLKCRSTPNEGIIRAVAFQPATEELVAVATESRIIRLLRTDCTAARDLEEPESSPAWRKLLAFSADGRWLVSGSQQGTLAIWDTQAWKRVRSIAAHKDDILALTFVAGDSTRLISTSYDKTLRMWQIPSGEALKTSEILERQSNPVSALAVSPDGQTLATVGQDVALWRLADYQRIATLAGAGATSALQFSADGKMLVTADRKGKLIEWDVATWRELATAAPDRQDGADAVQALALDPASGTVASAVLGRVQFRALPVLPTLQSVLWQAGGAWAVWSALAGKGTLYRHETGGLVWAQQPGGLLTRVAPQRLASDPKLELKLSLEPSGTDWEPGSLNATLSNTGGPALWLKWSVVHPAGQPRVLTFSPPEDVMRLESGVTLPEKKILLNRLVHWTPPWQRLQVCIQVQPLHGKESSLCHPVPNGPWWWRHLHETLAVLTLLWFATAGRRLLRRRQVSGLAKRFAESLVTRLDTQPVAIIDDNELTVFRISLPALPLSVADSCLLIVCMSKSIPIHVALARCEPAALGHPRLALLLDLTGQNGKPEEIKLALKDAHTSKIFVVLPEQTVHAITATKNVQQARDLLRVAILEQCSIEQILPYRVGGNGITDDEENFFFGRHKELERLVERYQHNFLLVGPRQMGKSSLLNALRRTLARRHPEIRVLRYQFSKEVGIQSISKEDPALSANTPEEFFNSVMDRTRAHQIFLLDEADEFIKQERQTQYAFCDVMRALSGQERASFVLAGHQELHDAIRSPDHPLRNFGELLRLEPLDPQSAQRMIVDPLTALGLHISEQDSAVEWLRTQTACRPYLLAQACASIARLKKPLCREPLTLAEIQSAVLDHSLLHDAFGDWDATQGSALIDCVVIRAALLLSRATLPELEQFLSKQGANLSDVDIDRSVNRLYTRHYAMVADADGSWHCPVPMFRYFLSNPHPDSPGAQRWNSAEDRLRDQLARDIAALMLPTSTNR